ncbi:hypothetical protein [Roseobacter sp.]|uniref:hypothetical protein n=1 Tax=Roseobacter sp. TaxID=1907202 RepID=UPI0032993AF3
MTTPVNQSTPPPKPPQPAVLRWGAAWGGWLRHGLRKIGPGVACVVVIGLAVAAFQEKPTLWPHHAKYLLAALRTALFEPELPGVLSIEPPQLYTRERLVNDRFRQANWLEQQLAKTKNGTPLAPTSYDTRAQSTWITTADPQSDANTTPATAPPTSALQQLDAAAKMRLQLRTDLMDTLLDDGHDLEGNTLYRLNFDAVVMPLIGRRSYPGTAMFIIEARNTYGFDIKACLDAGSVCPEPQRAKIRQRVADDVELLRDWQREIQQFLTKVLATRNEAFRASGRLHNPLDPKENIALDWFLRRELITSFLGAVVYDPEVLGLCRAQGVLGDDQTTATGLVRGWADGCKDWVAQALGLEWRVAHPSPGVSQSEALAPMIEASFRKSIGRAHYINTVLAIEGDLLIQRLQPRPLAAETKAQPRPAPQLWEALQTSDTCTGGGSQTTNCAPQNGTQTSPINVGGLPKDDDYKRALIRLIAVWQSMETYGHEARFAKMMASEMGATDGATNGATPSQKAPHDGPATAPSGNTDAKFQLLQVLGKYEAQLPSQQDMADLRKRLRKEGAKEFLLVNGQPMAHPKFQTSTRTCMEAPRQGKTSEFGHMYKCLMLRQGGVEASHRLLSQFLLARLQEELDVYDRDNRSIRDFLDISLEGCSTTGCRIQVSRHRDLPGNEVFGAREAGFLPSMNKLQQTGPINDMIASLNQVLGGLKAATRVPQRPEKVFPVVFGGSDWQMYLKQYCGATNRDLPAIRLDDTGLKVANLIIDHMMSTPQSGAQSTGGCGVTQRSYESRQRLDTSKLCLTLAAQNADNHEARTEIYLSCMLRDWINTQRSDVTVYAVSPRAGNGDDLTHQIAQATTQLQASAGSLGTQAGLRQTHGTQDIIANPRVIGFSHLPGADADDPTRRGAFTDSATFGWAIRPRKLAATGGYQSSHNRLSAVISLPSWWKRVDFDVRACWVQRQDVDAPNTDFTKLCAAESDARSATQDQGQPESGQQFQRQFEIKLPRRVEEITSRFNFDFIRAPYYYREFDKYIERYPLILSLEAGRSGNLILQGERLWRGTVVTVNNQSADSIVVLPDMKGVVAHFKCVYPPDGSFHVVPYEEGHEQAKLERGPATGKGARLGVSTQQPNQDIPRAPLFVWTSEGGTTDKEVMIHPFIQRGKTEKPCWLDPDGAE